MNPTQAQALVPAINAWLTSRGLAGYTVSMGADPDTGTAFITIRKSDGWFAQFTQVSHLAAWAQPLIQAHG